MSGKKLVKRIQKDAADVTKTAREFVREEVDRARNSKSAQAVRRTTASALRKASRASEALADKIERPKKSSVDPDELAEERLEGEGGPVPEFEIDDSE